ncbi:polysaccharide pyruvyl transferase family protein [Emticicia sp. BO119]|uniref:polysaccharide pyruvyl transferase family protein n=1 Tax=Emticicia sp. BO119 TaxID=2757768 RepID=UPI0015F0C38E|nr:polysaccharide pyruvyl transferase family protein [Emticicia sp. BO119]MBA4850519.1 polysaccharide pyruvyl transferase family protein [Emticicia sp. BO119]
MKIGILTHHYPENRNYGAMLQLFATYTTILKLGHTPVVINYKFTEDKVESIKSLTRDFILTHLGTQPFIEFSNKYLPNKTNEVTSSCAKELNSSIDLFLVGSDQVWRYSYVPNLEDFFFSFVDDSHKKISYAASFGLDKLNVPAKVLERVKELIKRFDAISVRETSGVKICEELGVYAQLVLDPVFLLEEEEYLKLIKNEEIFTRVNDRYIAHMLLDDYSGNINFINNLASKMNRKVFDLKGIKYPIVNRITNKLYSIPQWLNFIKNSEMIITDSYHCVAFCIILKKPFICIANPNRGMARLESLLGLLGLKHLFVTDAEYYKIDQIPEIDYNVVYEKLAFLKANSLEFLKEGLRT